MYKQIFNLDEIQIRYSWDLDATKIRGQTDRGYKKPVTNTDIEIAIPLGMKRIPDSENQYSFRYETDTG